MNVLWIMTDEQRCDSLGCYGSGWAHSPAMDRLAARGTLFHNAYTPAPLCVPARTTMLTGRTVADHGVWSNAELEMPVTGDLVGLFRQAGYATASFGKSHYACHTTRHLFETEVDQWYSPAVDPERYRKGHDEAAHGVIKYPSPYTKWILAGRFPEDEDQTSEWRAATDALTWLAEHRSRQPQDPFLLRVSFNGPHTPVTPPAQWLEAIDPDRIDIPPGSHWDRHQWPSWYRDSLWEYARSDRLTEAEIRTIRHHYYAQCAFVDSQVGRVLDYLDANGLWETTIVAFSSDHGTHLGDFGFVQKQTFFEPVARVPFALAAPDGAPGQSIRTPVSLAQLVPTFLDMCRVTAADATAVAAPSAFAPLTDSCINGREPAAQPVVSECTLGSIATWGINCPDHLRMVRLGEWKLAWSLENPGEGLLFNLATDPEERNNLFTEAGHEDVIAGLRDAADDGHATAGTS